MAKSSRITILYRMAEKKNKNPKNKPDWIDNQKCLANIVKYKGMASRLIVFGDNLDESKVMATALADKFIETKSHGNSETFLEVLQYALDNLEPDETVYFVEDDYIHSPNMNRAIAEGLSRADYVSLYDHPDKYGQSVKLFHTENMHWQFVPSTTMTFAVKMKTLTFDAKVFQEMITTGNPPDHHIFTFLTSQLHRRLATPIPSITTHCEIEWMAPVVNWDKYA